MNARNSPPSQAAQHDDVEVRIVARATLPTRYGDFQAVAFWNNVERCDHMALVRGDVEGAAEVLTRMHSECLTGDALGSLRCDCRDQLESSLRRVAAADRGIVLYLRQEGRGIGLMNKLRAYELQDGGLDTVEANHALGFGDDERSYTLAARMLQALRPASVRLMTNNPRKVAALVENGITVARERHELPANPHNKRYLETKASRSGHLLQLGALVAK